MSRSWCIRTFVLPILVSLAGGVLSPRAAEAASHAPLRIRVPDTAGMAVKRAVLAARQRLGASRCRQVLAEFREQASERSLTAVLDELGRTPEEQLDALVFEDGSRRPPCASPQVLAFTRPHSETVYVCASQFKSAVRNDPARAEMVLIHELLHTLGLGENPPTSLEITARVTEVCGDVSNRRADARP
jgi:hypothetical protein